MTGGEWLKHMVLAAFTQPDGVAINLKPEAKTAAEDQPELDLKS